jgi:hypothetical protein
MRAICLGEDGTEQFTVETRVNGELIRHQEIHDPFICNTTVIYGLRAAWVALVRGIRVEVVVRGSEGAQRAVMTLDPKKLRVDTEEILEARRLARRLARETRPVGYEAQP